MESLAHRRYEARQNVPPPADPGNPQMRGQQPPVADLLAMILLQNEERDKVMQRKDEMLERLMTQIMQNQQSGQQNTNIIPNHTPTYHIVPDLSKDIRIFNGEEGNTAAKEWLR